MLMGYVSIVMMQSFEIHLGGPWKHIN